MKKNTSVHAKCFRQLLFIVGFIVCLFQTNNLLANNIIVKNASLSSPQSGNGVQVHFDLSWKNSFCFTDSCGVRNYDAAWIFAKYRVKNPDGTSGPWVHVPLSNVGHVVSPSYSLSVGLRNPKGVYSSVNNPGIGVFIHRTTDGYGDVNLTNVQLNWNHNGTERVDIKVFAVEMVYVPTGSFYLGSGGSMELGSFTDGSWISGNSIPYRIKDENELQVKHESGALWGTSGNVTQNTGSVTDYSSAILNQNETSATIPASFPKGYTSFYCMKYEISEDQYRSFLSTLSSSEQDKYIGTGFKKYRNSTTRDSIASRSNGPERYLPYCGLSWDNFIGYADWSGLRPMTEFEYEKAARGPIDPVSNEFAWGNTNLIKSDGILKAYQADETSRNANEGNSRYDNDCPSGDCGKTEKGPLRVGASATANSDRTKAGASYYGIMDLTGNGKEWLISATSGRFFTGDHGNGDLTEVPFWPKVSTSDNSKVEGAGHRGGSFETSQVNINQLRISDRSEANDQSTSSAVSQSGRAVRTAADGIPEPTSIQVKTDTNVVNHYTATCNGLITIAGNQTAITDRGICWSTIPGPSIYLPNNPGISNVEHNGSGIGSFSCDMNGLTPCTTYYIRAFAVTCLGTTYGNQISFVTDKVPDAGGEIISPVNSVCSGGTVELKLQNYTGAIQWQHLINGSWKNIDGAINSAYTTPVLTAIGNPLDYNYRAKVTNGICAPVYSAQAVKITAIPYPTFTSITGLLNVCMNLTGNRKDSYRAIVKNGNGNPIVFSVKPSKAGVIDDNGDMTFDKDFYGNAFITFTAHGCNNQKVDSTIKVVVDPINKGKLLTSQNVGVCSGGKTIIRTEGYGGTFQWKYSTIANLPNDDSRWIIISNATGDTLLTPPVTQTTYFQAKITSSACATTEWTDIVKVDIASTSSKPTAKGLQTLCDETKPHHFSELQVSGETSATFTWYDALTVGNQIDTSKTVLSNRKYYVSQTTTCGESARTEVEVAINLKSNPKPTANGLQTFCDNVTHTIAELIVNGEAGATFNWYNDATTATTLPTGTVLTSKDYYVSQVTACGESGRVKVQVALNSSAKPLPTATGLQTFCNDVTHTIAELAVNGEAGATFNWYNDATTATTLPVGTVLTSKDYYVSQVTACGESGRVKVQVALNSSAKPLPTANGLQTFCDNVTHTIAELIVNGEAGATFNWYNDATTATTLPVGTVLTSKDYYVSQVTACGESGRVKVQVALNSSAKPLPTANGLQTFCDNVTHTIAELIVNGEAGATFNWYNDATTATTLPTGTVLTSKDYYVSQVTACGESGRVKVQVALNSSAKPLPTANGLQTFCDNVTHTIAELIVSGEAGATFNWYNDATTATTLPVGTVLTSKDYYVSQVTTCGESGRIKVQVALNSSAKPLPTANGLQTFCDNVTHTIAELIVNGEAGATFNWYSDATTASTLPTGTTLTSKDYYVSQVTACGESGRVKVQVALNSSAKPLPTANGLQTFCDDVTHTIAELIVSGEAGATFNWYSNATTATTLPVGTVLTSKDYYVSQVTTCGESGRIKVQVALNSSAKPLPTANGLQTFCDNVTHTIAELTANGEAGATFNWYNDATTATTLLTGTVLTSKDYYVSQVTTCGESGRVKVQVALNSSAKPLPTANGLQTFCDNVTHTIAELAVNGEIGATFNWYSNATTATTLLPGTALTSKDYYVSQVTACGESGRVKVQVALNSSAKPLPTANGLQTFCDNVTHTITELIVNGEIGATFNWYSNATTATTLLPGTALTSKDYYVSQVTACGESGRVKVQVALNSSAKPLPTANGLQTFCDNVTHTIAELIVNGEAGATFNWYSDATTATTLTTGTVLTSKDYYVSQVTTCGESGRVKVEVALNSFAKPLPTANGLQTFCDNVTHTIAELAVNGEIGATFNWYSNATTATTLLPGTALTSKDYYVSQVTACGESGRVKVQVALNSSAKPLPTANGLQTFCDNVTHTIAELIVNGEAGATFNWYSDATTATTLPTGTVLTSKDYYVSQVTTCGESGRIKVQVALNSSAKPLPTANGLQTFCDNVTHTIAELIVNGEAGATFNWYNDATTATTLTTGTVLTSKDYYVSQVTTCGESARVKVQVALNSSAKPLPTATGLQTFCNDVTHTIAELIVNGEAGATFNWYNDATTATTLPTGTVLTSKDYYVSQVTACGESGRVKVQVALNSSAKPLPTATGLQTFCNDVTHAIAELAVNGEAGATFNWYSDATIATPLLPGTALTSKDYYVSQVTACGESGRVKVQVALNSSAKPLPTATGLQTFCNDVTHAIAELAVNGEAGATFNWYSDATIATPLLPGTALTSKDYYVSQVTACGESGRVKVQVALNSSAKPLPTANGLQTFCDNVTHTIAELIVNGEAGATFNWYNDATTATTLPVGTVLTSKDYYVSQVTTCGESGRVKVQVIIDSNPTPAPTTDAQSFCAKNSPEVSNLAATGRNIKWYADATTTTTLNSNVSLSTKTYYVTQTTSCGESTRIPVAVTVTEKPADAGAISGLASVSQNQNNVSYSVPSIDRATSYEWQYVYNASNGTDVNIADLGRTTNSISINFGANASNGTLKVRGVNLCDNGEWSEFPINVLSLTDPTGIDATNNAICQGGTTTLSPNGGSGDVFKWYANAICTIAASGTRNGNSIVVSPIVNTTYWGRWERGTTYSEAKNITIAIYPSSGINSSTSITTNNATPTCRATGVTYSVPATLNSTYTWTVPVGAIIRSGETGLNNNVITVDLGENNGYVKVVETTTDNCKDSTQLLVEMTGCDLHANFGVDKTTVCVDDVVKFTDLSTNVIDGTTTYLWDFGANATVVPPLAATTKGPHYVTYSTSGQKTVKLTLNEGTPNENIEEKVDFVTVKPAPELNGVEQDSPVCDGNPATINLVGLLPNATSTITYSINGVDQPTVDVTTNADGDDVSFTTRPLTYADNNTTLLVTEIKIAGALPNCSKVFNVSANLQVNPKPSLTTATQTAVCDGSSGTVSLTGLLASTAQTVSYTIDGIAQTDVVVTSNSSGVASFTTRGLVYANDNGQALRITTIKANATTCSTTINKDVTLAVNPINTVGAASSTPTLCVNTALTAITHSTTGATGIGTPIGLPNGVTASWASNTITITGTPTTAVGSPFNYTIPLTGGCGTVNATGKITVTQANTVGAASSTPTLCVNTALTAITHSTTGATGIGTPIGLPNGVTASWASNTITITGTPTTAVGSPFNYTIPLTGGCGTVNATGKITVTQANTVGAASSTPTLCVNTALTAITHSTTGATGIGTPIGLPNGVTASWASNTITITGTPTTAVGSPFNYTIPLTGGCGTVNATGKITVTQANTVGAASSTPTLCVNTALTAITHSTTGATGIGTPTGLPDGVTASWASNTITITGTPTTAVGSPFNYTIPLTGGCGTVNATGKITVTQANTVGAASSTPTLCVNTALTAITHSTTGATGIGTPIGLPNGVTASWASNTITITGTPTTAVGSPFNYTIPLTGGCGTVNATGKITVTQANTVGAASSTPTLCVNTALTAITHSTTGATGIGTPIGLPNGVTASWASNTITITGTPTTAVGSPFNYTIPLTGGCGTVNATGKITVTQANTVGAASSTPTLCVNTALTAITHSTTGATGIGTPIGLPNGVTASWASNTITITGTPTTAVGSPFNYTIPLTGGCGTVNATGKITVTQANTVGAASSTPTLCVNTALTAITHSTTGATGIGTPTGLPDGVTASWASNTITITGTPTTAVGSPFNYTIPLTGGCGTVNATGKITVTQANTVGAASSTPTLCVNTALTAITHSTTGATGIGTPTGLPDGVTASWASNTITITGTPTTAVGSPFNYTIPLTGGCGTVNATGKITVTQANTVGAASSTPTLCVNTALTAITHSTTGATGIGTPTGLPDGVTASWASNTITITGTPTTAVGSPFNYTIPLTGGCGTVNATGKITVTQANTVGAASSTPTLCVNTALTAITHSTTGATGIGTPTGLPDGVTASWASNTITITGTPTTAVGSPFNYTIPLTGGCGTVNATGKITVTQANTVGAASSTPTLCVNTALTAITHSTTGATGIGTPTGLPDGVTASWASNTITITGTPTTAVGSPFNYTIPLTGGCGTVNATGKITVTQANTVGAASSTPTLCVNTALTAITHSTTGATGIGTPTGLPDGVTASWASNTITITGTPTTAVGSPFNYTIPLTGGCGTVNATGKITVTQANTVGAASSTPTLCVNTALTAITHSTTGATGIGTPTGLPDGVTASWASNTITITGTPTTAVGSPFNYTIPLTGGCGTVNATGKITVTQANTVGAASSTPTLCVNTALTAITHSTTGATGIGTPTGLPDGVTASWASNTITITGTPTTAVGSPFNYTIPLTGGCGTVNATGKITVTQANTVGAASSTPTLCVNTALTAITHSTTGATGIGTPTGLPDGVTASWASNTITITGTPTTAVGSPFNYTIPLTGGCGTVNATGKITVTQANTVGAASSTPTLCVNTALTAITHSTTGATGIGTPTGLPDGVTASWASNTITITGTPTTAVGSPFNYTIPLTGGCGTVNATGKITVTQANTVGAASSTPTLCVNTALTAITHSTTGATGIGTPTGLPDGVTASWASNTITITGTPTTAVGSPFNYTIPLTGGCGTVNATGKITVTQANTVGAASSTPTLCVNTALTAITHSTTGATGIGTPTGLPDGVTASWASNTITITGTPTTAVGSPFNYTIPLTGGCGTVNATGKITVTQANTVGAASSTPTLCVNTALTAITHSTTGATGIGTPTGLPDGVTASWASNTITITGTPTTAVGSPFNYTIPLTGGCGTVNATGKITVTQANTVGAASSTPTLCVNTALTAITHSTTGATGIGTPTGLPDGVTASWASNTITITGTPTTTVGSPFNYTIPLTGGCGTVNATGKITITPTVGTPDDIKNFVTSNYVCQGGSSMLYTSATNATSYTWTVDATQGSISGSSTGSSVVINWKSDFSGTATVGVKANGCNGPSSEKTKQIIVRPMPTASLSGGRTVCQGDAAPEITFTNALDYDVKVWYKIGSTTGYSIDVPHNVNKKISVSTANPGSFDYEITRVDYTTAPACANPISAGTQKQTVTVTEKPVIIEHVAPACNTNYSAYEFQVEVSVGAVSCVKSNAQTENIGTIENVVVNGTATKYWKISGIPIGQSVIVKATNSGCVTSYPVTAPSCTCPSVATPNGGLDKEYCQGSTIPSISATVVAGRTVDWYSVSTEGTPLQSGSDTETSDHIYSYQPTAAGDYYAEARIIGSSPACTSSSRLKINVKEKSKPVINSASTATICSGDPLSYSITSNVTTTTTDVVSYSWSRIAVTGVNGGVAGSGTTSPISETLTNSSTDVKTVIYNITMTINGCTSDAFTLTVTVNPKPAITGMTKTVCSGDPFTVTPINGTTTGQNGTVPTGTTYTWLAPTGTGFSGGAAGTADNLMSITGTLTNTTTDATAATATYTVTPKTGDCTGAPFTVIVTVNKKPAINNITKMICSGDEVRITPAVNGTNGFVPDGTTYTAPGPVFNPENSIRVISQTTGVNGWTQTLSNTTGSQATATYTVTPSANGCTGDPFTVTVIVNSKPVTPVISADEYVCPNMPNYMASITNPLSGATYSWSITGGTISYGETSTIVHFSSGNNIGGYIVLTATQTLNGCTSNVGTKYIFITNGVPNKTIGASPLTVCNGQRGYIYVENSDVDVSYQLLDGIGGFIIGSSVQGTGGTIYLRTDVINKSRVFSVLATNINSGCWTNMPTHPVVNLDNPVMTTDGNLTPVCFGVDYQLSTLSYSAVTNLPISYSIDWDATANAAGLSDQGTTTFSFSPTGGIIDNIYISANVPLASYSGVMTLTNANGCTGTVNITIPGTFKWFTNTTNLTGVATNHLDGLPNTKNLIHWAYPTINFTSGLPLNINSYTTIRYPIGAVEYCMRMNYNALGDLKSGTTAANMWYLPAKSELQQMFIYKSCSTPFSEDFYWASTEGSTTGAWTIKFTLDCPGCSDSWDGYKPFYFKVRCVHK